MTRRKVLSATCQSAGLAALGSLLPAWARSGDAAATTGVTELSGTSFDLEIAHAPITIDGRSSNAITVNGHVPAPLLRWREGDEIVLRVTNHLHDHDTSIHWHGILVPFQMDGVPGVSFPGIKPGETFSYRFRVPQNGTYWYHSHSGLQEQLGHYGPIIIEPSGRDPVAYDREYVVVLSDWTFSDPHRLFGKLKKMSGSFNFQKRTIGDFFRDASREGLGKALENRAMWGAMRMDPTDIADVTGAAYTYLINGHAPADNWTALFKPGERVRLRIINASAMTIFNVRIPGLPMTVVQSDGLNVQPVETDEFQIGVAETYDVIVQPNTADAFTVMCESIDRSGYARATLAPSEGMVAEVPPLRPRPLLTMKDMGMDHGAMDHKGHESVPTTTNDPDANPHAGHNQAAAETPITADPHAGHRQAATKEPAAADPHAAHNHGATQPPPAADHKAHQAPAADPHAGHAGHAMPTTDASSDIGDMGGAQRHEHPGGPGNASLAMQPTNRLNEPGTGLENVPHRALTYAQLKSLDPNPDLREPGRELELHLTSNMERYMWSFDGKKFSDVVDPILFYKDERVRLTMVNDTMMPHPIHLHGMFFDVVNGAGNHKPRKHTIIVKPGEKLSVDITANAVGDWAFHCHLLYHMHAGMFRVVSVLDSKPEARS